MNRPFNYAQFYTTWHQSDKKYGNIEPEPIPIMYRAHDPILHAEENGYWCDEPSCPCRQDRSYCERYVKVEVS